MTLRAEVEISAEQVRAELDWLRGQFQAPEPDAVPSEEGFEPEMRDDEGPFDPAG